MTPPATRTFAGLAASALSAVAVRLPDRLVAPLGVVGGGVWYRVTPARAGRARRNLRRVCAHLADTGRATPRVAAAAVDDAALERLVRAAYRHAVRYYLEVARTPAVDRAYLARHLVLDDPAGVDAAFDAGPPFIVVGLHFGALEMPALYVAHRLGAPVTAPMEQVDDPGLQAWFIHSRSRVGVRIVTLAAARRELMAALGRGEPVGLVADRDITGGGIEVPFFGAPAPMPLGPALLAIETGVPVHVGGVRRAPGGRYRARLLPVDTTSDGSRRERARQLVARLAATFETIIADAPEQWWACFHPIWPDLEAAA